jgi:pimeloyl-ACP methyl ester carboxylesterase
MAQMTPQRTRAIRITLLVAAVLLTPVAVADLWLRSVTSPDRHVAGTTPSSLLLSYEEVTFYSVDGIQLAGWFIGSEEKAPTLILCHDLGEDRSALLNNAVPLQKAGYNLFLMDFRGHGRSAGACSLGITEKRDILGAIDYLMTRDDVDGRRFGLFGVGMGAHAGILAASDRKELRALALDSPYPDVRTFLARRLSSNETAQKYLTPLPMILYRLRFRTSTGTHSAGHVLPELTDRDLLLVVSKYDAHADEVHALYQSVPEGRESDRNLLELTSSRTKGLYAEDKKKYDETLLRFFADYLPLARGTAGERPRGMTGT